MTDGAIAFVYPGQGTQYIGMGSVLYRQYPTVRPLFEEASDVIGRDLLALCSRGPIEALTATVTAQPAIFTCNAASARVLEEHGVTAACTAGHSVGEFNALQTAGVFDFGTALRMVAARGAIMHRSAGSAGVMAAIIGLDAATVGELCENAAKFGPIGIGAFNGEGNVVVSGATEAVLMCAEMASAAGARSARRLATSHAFHSPLMLDVQDEWAEVTANAPMSAPVLPVACNHTGQVERDIERVRHGLVAQLSSPVRWSDCIQALLPTGVEVMVETGDSKVLCGLNRRIAPSVRHLSMSDPRTLQLLRQPEQARS